MRGRRLDVWNERRPVRDQHEQENRADKGAKRRWIALHRSPNLVVDGGDEDFDRSLRLGGGEREAARRQRRAAGKQRDDSPGDDDRLGDQRRADMEQGLERKRRFHASLSKRLSKRAREASTPNAAARRGAAP